MESQGADSLRRNGLFSRFGLIIEPVGAPEQFQWTVNKNGDVVVTHRGRKAAVLRGAKAEQFLADAEHDDAQELLARLTGNYKRGNEREARNHHRNRTR